MISRAAFYRVFAVMLLVAISGSSAFGSTKGKAARARFGYQVRETGESLSTISIRLYGDTTHWKEIARASHLRRPYGVRVGQELALVVAPKLTRKQGNAALLAFWRKRLDRENPGITQEFAETVRTQETSGSWEAARAAPSNAESMLKEGEALFSNKNYEPALDHFTQSRSADPDLLPAWFYEIRSLNALGRTEDARTVARALISRKPAMAGLPVIKKLLPAQK